MSAARDRASMIEAHALNELAVKPQSVTALDRLWLATEFKRLHDALEVIAGVGNVNTIHIARRALEEATPPRHMEFTRNTPEFVTSNAEARRIARQKS